MKLIAEINNEKRQIALRKEGEKIFAEIEGRELELEAQEVEPNVFLLKRDNRIFQVYVSPGQSVDAPLSATVGNDSFEIKIFDPKRLRGAGGAGGAGEGLAEIKTAMPGKVVRVLVEAGAEINQGDGVVIVEAMKMQNEMKSPKTGIVKEIRVAKGATVNAGEILAVIE
jgi:biotin carboxyl carrier protein